MTVSLAADCHFHVFGDERYPFAEDAGYRPLPNQMGRIEEILAVFLAHGITHGLAVAAGPYGTDNRCLLDAIHASAGRIKGIALVEPTVSEDELDRLAAGGIVGIRVHLMGHGAAPLRAPGMDALLGRMRERGWFVQVHGGVEDVAEALPILRAAGVRTIVDHFGRPDGARGIDQPAFQALLAFGRSTDAVIKLSGPFRTSSAAPHYEDIDPFIHAAIDAYTLDRCVWGSDWPWVRLDRRVDYGPVLDCLARWLPDERDRYKVLWETPARLFGFAAP